MSLPYDFDLQLADIQALESREQVAALFAMLGYNTEAAPTIVDPIQQTLVTVLQGHLNNPTLNRSEMRQIMASLRRPARRVVVTRLKVVYARYAAGQDIAALVRALQELLDGAGPTQPDAMPQALPLTREDLRLICFEHIVS